MYRFRSVDVSNVGPFDNNQVLEFGDGLTVVLGANGTGKTTLVKKLRVEYEKMQRVLFGLAEIRIPAWLVFFDEHVSLPYGGQPWASLSHLNSFFPKLIEKRKCFEGEVESSLGLLLSPKILGRPSKVSGRSYLDESLSITLANESTVNVTGSDDTDLNAHFWAVGERTALFLSINLAVRKVLELDLPFVVDSQLGRLDHELLRRVFGVIASFGEQSIVVEGLWVLEYLNVKPTFWIDVDPATKKSVFERGLVHGR